MVIILTPRQLKLIDAKLALTMKILHARIKNSLRAAEE
jgi:hypothetical protein